MTDAATDTIQPLPPGDRLQTRAGDELGAIGMGTMGIGGFFQRDDENDAAGRTALETAIDSGIRLFDTAEAYGAGHSEELLGEVMTSCRDQLFVSTKVSPEHLRPENLRRAAYQSLERLRTDYIDLYYIHWPNPAVPIQETMSAMGELADEGIVRHLGLSNFMAGEAAIAEAASPRYPIAAIQAEYNLFDRTHEDDVLPFCKDRNIPVIAYSPLDVGRHATALPNAAIDDLARRFDMTPAQLVLKWVTRKTGVIAIPKALTPEHVRQNAAVNNLPDPNDAFDDLERLTAPVLINVDPKCIRTDDNGISAFVPGPENLAAPLRDGVRLKPVRLVPSNASDDFDYDLVEGKLRYWAWKAAFPDGRPIPALVRP